VECNHCKAQLKKGGDESTKRVVGAPECDGDSNKAIEAQKTRKDTVEGVNEHGVSRETLKGGKSYVEVEEGRIRKLRESPLVHQLVQWGEERALQHNWTKVDKLDKLEQIGVFRGGKVPSVCDKVDA